MAGYLDQWYEYYTSGQYFTDVYKTDAEAVFKRAMEGKDKAIKMYEDMGTLLGNTIKMIMYALDVELIILGGISTACLSLFLLNNPSAT